MAINNRVYISKFSAARFVATLPEKLQRKARIVFGYWRDADTGHKLAGYRVFA